MVQSRSPTSCGQLTSWREKAFSLNGTIGKITPFLFRQRMHRGGEGPECHTRQSSFAWKKSLVEGINSDPFECPEESR